MKKANILVTTMCCMMLVLSVFGISTRVSKASTTDTNWGFSLSVNDSGYQYMSARAKSNTSKIYIYWITCNYGAVSSITVSPYGTATAHGALQAAGTANGGVRAYSMNAYGKYSLRNYVHELGLGYARPGMRGAGGSGVASGKWSPDSTKNYTLLQ
ncbi:MAG: hypothetical protein IKQ71_01890 [Lachnospiraceae bacterium]|nr:hypothetical protein [Lachnospiraceae bacterium]